MATMDLDLSPRRLVLRLSELLVEKEVSAPRAEERATMGLKKIWATEPQQALDSANPWAYLKAIGSRPHVAFQWLKSDELQNKIRARAPTKFAIQPSEKRKQRANKPQKDASIWIDPAQLQLVPQTSFAQGRDVPQIGFSEVGPQASGIAFASVADSTPFLQAGQLISDKPLGILTTSRLLAQCFGLIVPML